MPTVLRWLLTLGPLNPIAVRLVQNGSRRSKHMYVRAGYLAVLIVVLLWSLLLNAGGGQPSYRQLAETGAASFVAIAYLQVALICVLAPVFMATAIANESNPKTWDILLTTPLGAGQIVLGNLLGRLVFVLALLFASLPLFALTQYFGGVPGRAIFASYLVAGCAAVVVGAIAISLAVSRLVGRRTVFVFYVSVVSYLAVTAAADALLRSTSGSGGVTWLTGLNPFLALRALLNPAGYPRVEPGTHAGLAALFLETPVTAWVLVSLGLSVLLTAASTLTVRTGGLQRVVAARGGRAPWYRRLLGLGAAGAEHRPPRSVSNNPIAWREAAARNATLGRIVARWAFVAAGLIAGVVVVAMFHTGALDAETFRLIVLSATWTEAAVIALLAINMSATAVSREREDGTLDLLLTTPITPGDYLTGKLRGLVAYLLPLLAVPIGTLVFAGGYVALGGFGRTGGVTVPIPAGGAVAPVILPEAAVVAGLVLVPFTAFCVMVGLHWSLKSKGTIGSVVATVAVVGLFGGLVGLCGWQGGSAVEVLGPGLAGLSPVSALFAVAAPDDAMYETVVSGGGGMTTARTFLLGGAVTAAVLHAVIVYLLHASMVKGFDFTVRKLAGTN